MTIEYTDPFAAIDTSAIDAGGLALVDDAEHAGEGSAEGGSDAESVVDPVRLEAITLANVAEANSTTVLTPEVEAKIAQIEQELRGGVSVEKTESESGIPAEVESAMEWLKKSGAYAEKFSKLTSGKTPDKEFIEQMIHTLQTTPKEKYTKTDGGFSVERYDTSVGEKALEEYLKRLG